ncbi:MAG: hypothetical protein ACRD36_12650 [Candidatus Acidiferrum sp.]
MGVVHALTVGGTDVMGAINKLGAQIQALEGQITQLAGQVAALHG